MQFFVLNEVRPSLKVTKGSLYIYKPNFSLIYFLCLNLILPKFGINANIRKMQFFDNLKFDLIITLTFVLMENFRPSFTNYC